MRRYKRSLPPSLTTPSHAPPTSKIQVSPCTRLSITYKHSTSYGAVYSVSKGRSKQKYVNYGIVSFFSFFLSTKIFSFINVNNFLNGHLINSPARVDLTMDLPICDWVRTGKIFLSEEGRKPLRDRISVGGETYNDTGLLSGEFSEEWNVGLYRIHWYRRTR